MHPINFKLDLRQTEDGLTYQHLSYELEKTTNNYIAPSSLKTLQLPAELTNAAGIIIDGKGPNWLYSHLTAQFQTMPWVGCNAKGTGAVVVKSQSSNIPVGHILLPELLTPISNQQNTDPRIELQVIQRSGETHAINHTDPIGDHQIVIIKLHQEPSLVEEHGEYRLKDYHIDPQELATLELPTLDYSKGIIFYGWSPTWLYAHLTSRCQSAPWVACGNIHSDAAIVVSSQSAAVHPGDEVPIRLNPKQGIAIVIGGPADSGKSVFAYALQRSLRQYFQEQANTQEIFLHRANWDGEGNWAHETEADEREKLIKRYENRIHEGSNAKKDMMQFFNKQTAIVTKMCQLLDVVLVDIGGLVQSEKDPLFAACSYYIVVSKCPKLAAEWKTEFEKRGLQPIAIVHSVQTQGYQILAGDGFLEIEAGSWKRGEPDLLPNMTPFLEAIVKKLS
jgi:CRISPR-associated protein Csx3